MTSLEEVKSKLNDQQHILTFWDELNSCERNELMSQIATFDFEHLTEAFKKSLLPHLPNDEDIAQIEPDRCVDRASLSAADFNRLESLGLKAIAERKVAAIVMAGGQATRLGADKPKGILKLGTGVGMDSLLFFQACQIVRLMKCAKEKFPDSNPSILWLIMTSDYTYPDTKEYIDVVAEKVGLAKEDIIYFLQKQVPSFDFDGKILLANKHKIATSPNGNGGLYHSIEPLISTFKSRGINYIHVYSVDNILCRVADPTFIGAIIDKKADASAKVIEKKNPKEAVGHVCRVKGRVQVIEYSEISKELMERRDSSGKLFLRAGNIANHLFTFDFLKKVCDHLDDFLYHVARKKIPFIDLKSGQMVNPTEPKGIKLELFIFDAFQFSDNFMLYQVPADEFSPLKNADSIGHDCFKTCVEAFNTPHAKWLRDACDI